MRFDKRNHTESQGGYGSDPESLLAVIGVIIAALILLVATILVLRCRRFPSWVSSFSISSLGKKTLRIAIPIASQTIITAGRHLRDIPLAQDPIHSHITIYNNRPNTQIVNINSNTASCCHAAITPGDGRLPQVGEPPGWGRPAPESLGRFDEDRNFVRL
ncbi:hypothetical protein HOY80DRAFT_1078497 [Tuber brumale]|nr:hypothetical protein HOY80DRAFT_1078497 [Tuber brumale]